MTEENKHVQSWDELQWHNVHIDFHKNRSIDTKNEIHNTLSQQHTCFQSGGKVNQGRQQFTNQVTVQDAEGCL
jgi:hypothetical protein